MSRAYGIWHKESALWFAGYDKVTGEPLFHNTKAAALSPKFHAEAQALLLFCNHQTQVSVTNDPV